jgi:hypothetical protein
MALLTLAYINNSLQRVGSSAAQDFTHSSPLDARMRPERFLTSSQAPAVELSGNAYCYCYK